MAELVIEDRDLGTVEVNGVLIGKIDTRDGAPEQEKFRQRWSVNQVWRLPNGSYLLIREAYSLVYHTEPTSCRSLNDVTPGEPVTAAEMITELGRLGDTLDDAEPCEFCRPPYPEDLREDSKIRYEVPRRFFDECPTGTAVMRVLVRRTGRGGSRVSALGRPARALLEACRAADPNFVSAEPVTTFGT